MDLDFTTLSPNQVYHTLIQSIVPRPIAWVLSENQDTSLNLAPFSYFTAIASDPPLIMFSVGKRPDNGDSKDTLVNIVSKKQFVVHIASQSLVKEVALSASPLPYGESEVSHTGLETCDFNHFKLPRLTQAKIALACELYEIKEIGNKPMALVFGEIKHAYFADEIVTLDGKRTNIDASKLDPLVRLGGDDYAGISQHFRVDRPK